MPKSPRITLPAEIEQIEKKNAKPGPGAYDSRIKERHLGAFNLKDMKGSFIEEAEFNSMQTPSAKYAIKYDLITPHKSGVRYVKPKYSPEE